MIGAKSTCELCGGEESTLFISLDFFMQSYPGKFILFRCASCGLLFNRPRLDGDALAALYDANYYLFWEKPAQALIRIVRLYNETVALLATVTSERRVLEIGCSKGWMLGLLRELGWSTKGIELSEHAAGFAVNRMNLPVFHGTLENWVTSPGFEPFPVVFSTDVIEHVPDLHGFIAALAMATAPGGWLLLSTPNGDSRGIASLGKNWLGFNPFHIRFLNRSNLAQLLESHGFQVVQAYSYNNLTPLATPAPRALTRLAYAMGVFSLVQRVIASIGEKLNALSTPLPIRLKHAAVSVSEATSFFTTADGRQASACLGDNLVILACKSQ